MRRSPSSGGERRCLLCGCLLASDEPRRVYVCGPDRRARHDYDPACDSAFDRLLQDLFVAHPCEIIHPRQALGVDVKFKNAVGTAVRRLRRRLNIVGVPHTGGYVYVPDDSDRP